MPEKRKEAAKRIARARSKKAKALVLKGLGLTSAPPEIVALTQLQSLHLDNNQLTSVPPEIAALTQLQRLYLGNNQLISLPPEIAALTQLRKLELRYNQLTSLPPEIAALTQLRILDLHVNQLASVPPEIAKLTQLQELYLTGNQLASLPPEIAALTQLQELYLAGNQLASLPPEIAALTQLQEFYLRGNQLTSVPPEVVEFLIRIPLLNIEATHLQALIRGSQKPRILRSIEFPPEYFEAGKSILSYFGTALSHKYPDTQPAVTITQEGQKITMAIEMPEGQREEIERTFEEYGLVAQGRMTAEELLDDPGHVLQLKNELRMAQTRLETQRDIMAFQQANLGELREQMRQLFALVGQVAKRPVELHVTADAHAGAHAHASASAQQTFQLVHHAAPLAGHLRQLANPGLGLPETERRHLEAAGQDLEELASDAEPEAARPVLERVGGLLGQLGDDKSKLAKTLGGAKKGLEIAQGLARHYNAIAQWCGLPMVPKPLLGQGDE